MLGSFFITSRSLRWIMLFISDYYRRYEQTHFHHLHCFLPPSYIRFDAVSLKRVVAYRYLQTLLGSEASCWLVILLARDIHEVDLPPCCFRTYLPLASSRLSAVGNEQKKGKQEKQRGGKFVVSLARLLFCFALPRLPRAWKKLISGLPANC